MAMPDPATRMPAEGNVVAFQQLLNGPTTRSVPATVLAVVDEQAGTLDLELMTPNRLRVAAVPPQRKTSDWKVWRYADAHERKSWGVSGGSSDD